MLDEPVRLEPHNPHWKEAFQSEQNRLAYELRVPLDAIEHIGSTAVPHLLAKPTVDIMVGVDVFPPSATWSEGLSRLGYEALGEAGVSGRLYFRQRHHADFNVHVVERSGTHWLRNLALREYLRRSPAAAAEYASAKRAAISDGATTLLAYSEAKGRVVEQLMRRALEPTRSD